MKKYRVTLIPLLTLFVAGCTGSGEEDSKMPENLRVALEKATQFELLSLSPERPDQAPPSDSFHRNAVLGKTIVHDAEVRNRLVTAFKKAIVETRAVPGCFHPRHGIRVTYQEQPVDFVICFECIQVQAYIGEKQVKGFLVDGTPEAAFDDVLREAKVALAEKSERR